MSPQPVHLCHHFSIAGNKTPAASRRGQAMHSQKGLDRCSTETYPGPKKSVEDSQNGRQVQVDKLFPGGKVSRCIIGLECQGIFRARPFHRDLDGDDTRCRNHEEHDQVCRPESDRSPMPRRGSRLDTGLRIMAQQRPLPIHRYRRSLGMR